MPAWGALLSPPGNWLLQPQKIKISRRWRGWYGFGFRPKFGAQPKRTRIGCFDSIITRTKGKWSCKGTQPPCYRSSKVSCGKIMSNKNLPLTCLSFIKMLLSLCSRRVYVSLQYSHGGQPTVLFDSSPPKKGTLPGVTILCGVKMQVLLHHTWKITNTMIFFHCNP